MAEDIFALIILSMVQKIVTFRDRDSAILFKKAKRIDKFDQSLCVLAETMEQTMEQADGLGLAAPQVSSSLAICLAKKGGKTIAFCNPKILKYSAEKDTMEEGCLSFPDIFFQVPRSQSITIEYQDLEGRRKKLRAKGLFARTIQHEVDHLYGVVFTNRAEKR